MILRKNKKGQEGGTNWVLVGMVIALIFLGIVLYLLLGHKKTVNDASTEVTSWLNLANPNCDYDHDGANNLQDICPCDDDNDYASRTYYLKDSQCPVVKINSYNYQLYLDAELAYENNPQGDVPNPEGDKYNLKNEYDNWVYSVDNVQGKDCKKAVENTLAKNRDVANSKICEVTGLTSEGSRIFYAKSTTTTTTDTEENKKYYSLKGLIGTADAQVVNTILTQNNIDVVLLFPEKCAEKILAWNAELDRATFTCRTATIDCKTKLKDQKTC